MKWDIRKKPGIFFVLAILLCTACGTKEPPEKTPADYSGIYTDKQGTAEVYSALELNRNEDGTYAVDVSIYRLISMSGTAAEAGAGKLYFECHVPDVHVAGDIVIDGESAELTITESDTYLLEPGMVCQFLDGRE